MEGSAAAGTEYEFTVVMERDEDGVFIVTCPAIQGCHSYGDTEDEAREMIAEAIQLHLEVRLERGEPIPQDVTTTTVRVRV